MPGRPCLESARAETGLRPRRPELSADCVRVADDPAERSSLGRAGPTGTNAVSCLRDRRPATYVSVRPPSTCSEAASGLRMLLREIFKSGELTRMQNKTGQNAEQETCARACGRISNADDSEKNVRKKTQSGLKTASKRGEIKAEQKQRIKKNITPIAVASSAKRNKKCQTVWLRHCNHGKTQITEN